VLHSYACFVCVLVCGCVYLHVRMCAYVCGRVYICVCMLGTTCYLNSLLQTLYMAKEFRKCIYEYKCPWQVGKPAKPDKKPDKPAAVAVPASNSSDKPVQPVHVQPVKSVQSAKSWKSKKPVKKLISEDEKKAIRCIPYQMQRLFAHLQLSDSCSVTTGGLTKSFGYVCIMCGCYVRVVILFLCFSFGCVVVCG